MPAIFLLCANSIMNLILLDMLSLICNCVHRAVVRVADAENLPFDADVFDVVLSSMVFSMVPNQEKMLKEMIRVAKPGGYGCHIHTWTNPLC